MATHYSSLDGITYRDTWLTIGSFDGGHIGHQRLIRDLDRNAHQFGAKSVVLTFHPHPTVILRGRTDPFYLTTVTEKAKLLDELGVDIIITHPFTYEISQSTAREFISYLSGHLGFRQLWVGQDFALGKGREGNVEYLKKLGGEFNYQVQVVEPITSHGRVVSSSHIRYLLSEGNVEEASILLGRPYRVGGEVIHGDGRGKSIGIPTANLETGPEKLIPASGVYACRVRLKDQLWPAAVNIGTRPTFESADTRYHVEAHILDYSNDLYTQNIIIEFISRLRGEQRFQSINELIDQVQVDINKTREIIAKVSNY